MKRLLTCVLISMLILSVTGCNFFGHSGNNSTAPGGDPGGSDDPTGDLEGFFIDSGVAGLTYTASPSGITGTTDADGRYKYNAGDTVTFSIGSIVLGSSEGAQYITPMTFNPDDEEVGVRIAQMLQSMDSDKNPDNGITPDPAAIEALKDIDLTSDSFETYLRDNLPANLTFVERGKAMNHMETTFNKYAINPNGHNHTIPKIFPGYDSEHGLELWLTKDGKTPAFVKELDNGGTLNSKTFNFVKAGSKIFFVADTPQYGTELWVTDGTDEGTHIVKDITEGIADTEIVNLTALGDKVVFHAASSSELKQPWVSDGTEDGTFILKEINKDSSLISLYVSDSIVYKDKIYFTAHSEEYRGAELWVSDGTTAGTKLFINYDPETESVNPFYLRVADGKLWFLHGDRNYPSLAMSDGTTAGTKDVGTSVDSYILAVFKDRLYYVSDGDLYYISGGIKTKVAYVGSVSQLAPGETYLYCVRTAQGLYVTDGEEDSYMINISDSEARSASSSSRVVTIGDIAYFGNSISGYNIGSELFKANGAKFSLVKDINPGENNSSIPQNFAVMNNKLYFTAKTDTEGRELWVSDGTEAGTHIVKDINTGTHMSGNTEVPNDSILSSISVIDNKLYFGAESADGNRGLWVSDGTEAGTKLLVDANKEPASGMYPKSNIFMVGNKFIFMKGNDVWVSDGTADGTADTGQTTYSLSVNADMGDYKIVMLPYENSYKIMKTDGTLEGTSIIENFDYIDSDFITVTGGKLFFVGNQASGETEKLYVSDGTENSAKPFLDADSNEIENIAILAGTDDMMLTRTESDNGSEYTHKMYVSDSTSAGTDDMMLIRTESDNGSEYTHKMYVSDGTSAGTKVIAETTTEEDDDIYYSGFLFADGIGYYTNMTAEKGLELWSTDGTTAGTVLVKHVADDANEFELINAVVVDETFYYVVRQNETIDTLWKTEGTPESTEMVKEFEVTAKSYGPRKRITPLAVIGDKLYFTTSEESNDAISKSANVVAHSKGSDLNVEYSAWVIHNKTGMMQELDMGDLDLSDYTLAIPYGTTFGVTRGSEYMLAWLINQKNGSGKLIKVLGSSATVIQEADFIDIGEDD